MGKLIQFRKKRPKINDSNPNFYAKGCLIHVNIYEEEIINITKILQKRVSLFGF